jgi:hypothetical protein
MRAGACSSAGELSHTWPVGGGVGAGAVAGGGAGTISGFVRAHLDPSGCGLLPGGEELPDCDDVLSASRGGLRWAAGARDGMASHHVGVGVRDADIGELVVLIGGAIGESGPDSFDRLYERLRAGTALAIADELAGAVSRSALRRAGVAGLARRLVMSGRHAEPVKAGVALLGVSGSGQDRELLLTLGRHEEFTLFCAVAIRNCVPEPDRVLWALARSVEGWGRIYAVERLQSTGDEEIRDWIVRHGFRNSVADEYLAWIAATAGGLADRLERGARDDELVTAAGEIISALIAGGPAQDIDDYPEASRLLSRFVQLVSGRPPRLEHFVAVSDIASFVRRPHRWSERYQHGWTTRQRADLGVACEEVMSRPSWPALAITGLDSEDHKVFWAADRTASALGLDTFDAHWRRLLAEPVTGNWYAVMQAATDERIGAIIQLATDALDPDGLATGPANALGVGPEYAAHGALAFILQDLGRFPGCGWNLVQAGLRNPVVRVRNMAVKTLRAWPSSQWPAGAIPALADAARAEPADRTRQAMTETLASAGHHASTQEQTP